MRLFALMAILLITFAALFHMLFIMFDYAYYHPDDGVFTLLPERMNETMNSDYQNSTWNQTIMLRQAFGVGRFITLGLAVTMFVLSAADYVTLGRKKGG